MVYHYFSKSDVRDSITDASWTVLLHKIGLGTIKCFNEDALVKNRFLLVFHLLVLQRLQEAQSAGEKILVLQKLFKTLEELKVRLVRFSPFLAKTIVLRFPPIPVTKVKPNRSCCGAWWWWSV